MTLIWKWQMINRPLKKYYLQFFLNVNTFYIKRQFKSFCNFCDLVCHMQINSNYPPPTPPPLLPILTDYLSDLLADQHFHWKHIAFVCLGFCMSPEKMGWICTKITFLPFFQKIQLFHPFSVTNGTSFTHENCQSSANTMSGLAITTIKILLT